MRFHASVPLTSSLPPPSLLEEILYDLPPLEGVLLHWHTHGATALTPGIVSLFSRRKQLLGPATLPGASIQLLAICAEECLHQTRPGSVTAAPAPQSAPAIFSLRDLLDWELPPVRWAVPEILPEGLTLLAGKPKLGKSWLALSLAPSF